MPAPAAMKTPAGRAASQLVMSEFFRNRQEQLLSFIENSASLEDSPWADATVISSATARLTAAQTRELTHRIMAVIDETVDLYRHQTGEGVRPVTIRADVFPLPEIGDPS